MKWPLFILLCLSLKPGNAQQPDELPYAQIPSSGDTYSANTVAARMIDGLGFRLYWSTDNLRPEDLNFKPSEEARSTLETIQHIHGLTLMIHSTVMGEPVPRNDSGDMEYEELRAKSLMLLKEASDLLTKEDARSVSEMSILMQRGAYVTETPFWNLISGPIADAIWHTGQIASFRRSSGNPINPNVSFFNGTVRN